MKFKAFPYIIAVIVVVIISCNKYNDLKQDDPLTDPSYLHGRLFLSDTLTQNSVGVPLISKKVTLSYSDATDKNAYILSTTTDTEGYFKFVNINARRTYIISYTETVSGKTYFATSTAIALPAPAVTLVANLSLTGQNGMIVRVQTTSGVPVNGANVCIASSQVPSNNNTCDGSNYSLTSDANGHASTFGITAGTYYIFSKITINNVLYLGKQTIIVSNKVEQPIITLNIPPSVTPSNGLNVILVDKNNSPVANGTVCLFTSRILANRDTCENSNYSFTTDATGKGAITNLNPEKYYILGQVALKGLKLLARDSVTISDKIISDTLHLK